MAVLMPADVKCPKCGSPDLTLRKKRGTYICDDCDHGFEPEHVFEPKRIFLSYGHDEHVTLAECLKKDLEARGHEVWFDTDRLKPGGDWEAYIEEGIEWVAEDTASGRVVLLMTPHSVRRPDGYCLNEIAQSLNRRVSVVPLMVVWCEPPLSICRIQWLDMQDCVPVDERGERYEAKLDLLAEALEQDTLDFEGAQSRLRQVLDPLPFDADIAHHLERFTGRQWVFGRIDEWLVDADASRVFWIVGKPGVGKSAIAAWLCANRREVAAFHLCRHGHVQKADPRRAVLSIVYQLSTQLPDYRDRLSDLSLEEIAAESNARTLFDSLVVQPLAGNFPEPDRTIVVLIDALDEASHDGRNDLAAFVASEWSKTPSWLRLVITSRPDPEVMHPLQGLTPYVLDTGAPDNDADIVAYLERELKPLVPDGPVPADAIEAILERSEGVFLYVDWVRQELEAKRLTLDRIKDFPQGLGGVYAEFFKRQFPDEDEYADRVGPALDMVAAALEPLELSMIADELGWNDRDRVKFGRSLGSLFPVTDGVIQPFHRSVTDWLTNEDTAGPYYVSEVEGHQRIANLFWVDLFAGPAEVRGYTRRNLAEHFVILQQWGPLRSLLLEMPALRLIDGWVTTGDMRGGRCLSTAIDHCDLTARDRAGIATQIARIHSHQGEYDEANRWLDLAAAHATDESASRARAIALHERGSILLYHRDLKGAAEHYQQALDVCLAGGPEDADEASANRVALATVEAQRYDWQATLQMATQALADARAADDTDHALSSLRMQAHALHELDRSDEALGMIGKALGECAEARDQIEEARLRRLLGYVTYCQAAVGGLDFSDAAETLARAFEVSVEVGHYHSLHGARMWLARCAIAEGRLDDAAAWFDHLPSDPAAGTHQEFAIARLEGEAMLAHETGHADAAEIAYAQAAQMAQKHDFRMSAARALCGLGGILWHAGRTAEAETTWCEARDCAESAGPLCVRMSLHNAQRCRNDELATPR